MRRGPPEELSQRVFSSIHSAARKQPISGNFCFREALCASRLLQARRARLNEGWTSLLAKFRHRQASWQQAITQVG